MKLHTLLKHIEDRKPIDWDHHTQLSAVQLHLVSSALNFTKHVPYFIEILENHPNFLKEIIPHAFVDHALMLAIDQKDPVLFKHSVENHLSRTNREQDFFRCCLTHQCDVSAIFDLIVIKPKSQNTFEALDFVISNTPPSLRQNLKKNAIDKVIFSSMATSEEAWKLFHAHILPIDQQEAISWLFKSSHIQDLDHFIYASNILTKEERLSFLSYLKNLDPTSQLVSTYLSFPQSTTLVIKNDINDAIQATSMDPKDEEKGSGRREKTHKKM